MPSQLFSVERRLFPLVLPRYKANQLKNSTSNVRGGISSDGEWRLPQAAAIVYQKKEALTMDWEIPSFVEVKMDSEINSYQDDFKDLSETEEQSPEIVISTDHE